jgi:hypothetical protein
VKSEVAVAVVVDDNYWGCDDGSVEKDGNDHVVMDPGSNKAHERRNHSIGAADILEAAGTDECKEDRE